MKNNESAFVSKLLSMARANHSFLTRKNGFLMQIIINRSVIVDCSVVRSIVSHYGEQAREKRVNLTLALQWLKLAAEYNLIVLPTVATDLSNNGGSLFATITIWLCAEESEIFLLICFAINKMYESIELYKSLKRIVLKACFKARPRDSATDRAFETNVVRP